MAWIDKIQEFNTINRVGFGLLLLNFIMFPVLIFSSGEVEYVEINAPLVELLEKKPSLFERMAEITQQTSEKSHTHQSPEKKPEGAHSAKTSQHNEVDLHAKQNHVTKIHHQDNNRHRDLTPKKANKPDDSMAHEPEHQHQKSMHQSTLDLNKKNSHVEKTSMATSLMHVCYRLGPLKTNEEQIKIQNMVEAKGMFASLEYTKSEENLGYWVYIPPLRSRSLGRLKVEELKLKGFKDVVLLTRNKPKNAVSIGIFGDQKNATNQLHKAQSMGFDAKMDIRNQSLGEMWLLIEVRQQRDLNDQGWRELVIDYPHVQIRSIDCR